MTFSAHEKRIAASRELRSRLHGYPGRVARGQMTQTEADHEIAVMRAIEADYRKIEEEEAPPLFRAPVPP